MFNISRLTTEVGNLCIVVGGLPGQESISPHRLGPQVYTSSPRIGRWSKVFYSDIKFMDAGDSVSGPGDWSVQFHGSTANWFYSGEGQTVIDVTKNGQYTVTGRQEHDYWYRKSSRFSEVIGIQKFTNQRALWSTAAGPSVKES